MTRANIAILGLLCIVLGACTQRMVCPAYQSAFIYDKDELRKKFSYFLGDSTPKVYAASKTKYLVAEPMSYQKRLRNLQTVKMKPVPVVVPDSLTNKDSVIVADLDKAARSIIDSTVIVDVPKKDSVTEALDSVYVITKDKELRLLKYNGADSLDYDSVAQRYVVQRPKYYVADVRYNMEQDSYMWYLRDVIVLPDVRIAKMQRAEGGSESAGGKKKEKQGLKGFFKNLFKKKPKEEIDSTALQKPPQDEFDFIDEDSVSKAEVPLPGQEDKDAPPVKKKKEKVSRKKDKKASKSEPKPADKKKEEEDDGF